MTNEMKKLITKNSCKIANKNTPSQEMTLTTRQKCSRVEFSLSEKCIRKYAVIFLLNDYHLQG